MSNHTGDVQNTESVQGLRRGRPRVLTQEDHQRVAEMREKNPPLNVAEIARFLDRPWSTVRRAVQIADEAILRKREAQDD